MNLLSISNLSKLGREKPLFSSVSFGLNEGDKVALIGRNGTGKSTLLNTIAGILQPDEGSVVINKDSGISFLPQNPLFKEDETIREHIFKSDSQKLDIIREYENLCSQMESSSNKTSLQNKFDELSLKMDKMDLWNYEAQIKSILTTLGIKNLEVKMGCLSGGMIKKVALAQVLVEDTKLLLLDEPTNHLDINTIYWLQEYLVQTKRSVLMVTHDRYFLDAVCNHIYELDRNKIKLYVGNYSEYLEKKQTELEIEANTERRIESVLRFERDWLLRGPCARGTKAKARIQRDMALINREKFADPKGFTFEVEGRRLGGKVLELHNISKNFPKGFSRSVTSSGDAVDFRADFTSRTRDIAESAGGSATSVDSSSLSGGSSRLSGGLTATSAKSASSAKNQIPVIKNFSYNFTKGEKIGIFGDNGSGKSTLLNIITGKIKPDSGEIILGENTHIAYYQQNPVFENLNLTVLEYIKEKAEIIHRNDGSLLSANLFLEQFGFEGKIQYSPVSSLSGGERKKLFLVRLLISNPNFLILDEPTNDFDIFTMNVLEQFLMDFKGCLLIVSHDRYFMDKVADTLFILEDDGSISGFVGKCSEYIEFKNEKLKREELQLKNDKNLKAKNTRGEVSPSLQSQVATRFVGFSATLSAGEVSPASLNINSITTPPQVAKKTKRTFKEEKEFENLEKEIAELEEKQKILETQMSDSNYEIVKKAGDEYSKVSARLEECYARWEELAI